MGVHFLKVGTAYALNAPNGKIFMRSPSTCKCLPVYQISTF